MIVLYFRYTQQRSLRQLTTDETERQRREYENDVSRTSQGMAPASPDFIASYIMHGPMMVGPDQMFEICTICFQDYQKKQSYSQWPCEARHMFHYDCMLSLLKTGNKCPLCRHAV